MISFGYLSNKEMTQTWCRDVGTPLMKHGFRSPPFPNLLPWVQNHRQARFSSKFRVGKILPCTTWWQWITATKMGKSDLWHSFVVVVWGSFLVVRFLSDGCVKFLIYIKDEERRGEFQTCSNSNGHHNELITWEPFIHRRQFGERTNMFSFIFFWHWCCWQLLKMQVSFWIVLSLCTKKDFRFCGRWNITDIV